MKGMKLFAISAKYEEALPEMKQQIVVQLLLLLNM
jgi:hypothetical protein